MARRTCSSRAAAVGGQEGRRGCNEALGNEHPPARSAALHVHSGLVRGDILAPWPLGTLTTSPYRSGHRERHMGALSHRLGAPHQPVDRMCRSLLSLQLLVEGLRLDVQPAEEPGNCLLYTSPSPRDRTRSRMPSSA